MPDFEKLAGRWIWMGWHVKVEGPRGRFENLCASLAEESLMQMLQPGRVSVGTIASRG